MKTNETAKTLKKKVSVTGTLMSLEVGEVIVVKSTDVKVNVLRGAAHKLKERGYRFHISEKELVNQARVTRLQ